MMYAKFLFWEKLGGVLLVLVLVTRGKESQLPGLAWTVSANQKVK